MEKEMNKLLILSSFFILCNGCEKLEKCHFNKICKKEIIQLQETFISIPLEMKKQKDFLFISDFRGDSLLWIYDLKHSIVKRIIPRGEGPNEFLSPIQIAITDSTLFIHNRWHYSAKLYSFNYTDFTINPIGETIKLPTDIDRLLVIDSNSYIASGRFEKSRYVKLDVNGNIVTNFGKYPNYLQDEENIPNFPKFMFHQSMFAYNKSKDLIASSTQHVLDILENAINIPKIKKRILLSSYKYKYATGDGWASANGSSNTEIGVEDIYSTAQFIYLLYNPNKTKDKYSSTKSLNNEIWIFNWDGNPIKKIHTNMNIISFCIDENDQECYCIVNNPNPTISTFDL